MAQPSPYASGNHRLSFTLNGHSPNPNGTTRPSALEGQHRPTDVDPLNLHFFGNAAQSVTSGFLEDLDIAGLSSGRKAMAPPDDRSRFAGRELSDRLFQFYCDRDGPWNQEKSRVREHPEALPSSFTGFRETVALSECETSIGTGTLQSDSGYGSQARQSVGQPSIYGDVDRNQESLLSQLADFQIPGSSHSSFQAHDVNHLRHPWTQGTLARPNTVPTNNVPNHVCQYCPRTFTSQSDHKKHIARHEKPHRCPEPGCSKATQGFGTSNDLERHLKSVHRKSGTRYRCRHGACLPKAKDWPRADNFRSHLKKIHNICLDAEDSLEEYIYRPVNPEILSNVGVAPELIPTPVHGSSAPPSWSQLAQDTGMPMSGIGASEEFRLNQHDYLPPPVRPNYRSILESQQANDQNLARNDSIFFGVYPRQEGPYSSDGTPYQGMRSGGNIGFVRPNDLSGRSSDAMGSASAAEEPEMEAIVLDDEDDGEVGAPEGIDKHDDDYQVNSLRSPVSPSKPLQGRDELEPLLAEDMAQQHKKLDETHSCPASTEGPLKPGALPPPDPASTGSPDDLDKLNSEGAEAAFRRLLKLEPSQLEKLLLTHGYVKPKEPQAKPKKAVAMESLQHACLEPECLKVFSRPCELKKHLKRHEKPYGCTQCQKRFGSKNDWKRHENSQHFQHEIWKCDERLRAPLSSETCNKVCHRRETFKQHLVSHHGICDPPKQEDKLDRCRIDRLGEARFWCGFCREIIELEPENRSGQSPCNARYNHIDDHYYGRNGAVKKEASEWEGDVKVQPRVEESKEEKAVPCLRPVEGSRKRSRHASGQASKRVKLSPPSENIMWYCCQCNNAWNFSNVPSCINCPAHVRCNDCRLEEVEGKDDDQ